MTWEIKLEKKALKDLDKIPAKYQKKILTVLPVISADPYLGKKLEGKWAGFYSYPVWPYRIIYKIYKNILLVIIVRVGHRQGVY